jgi:hypothetical protein
MWEILSLTGRGVRPPQPPPHLGPPPVPTRWGLFWAMDCLPVKIMPLAIDLQVLTA